MMTFLLMITAFAVLLGVALLYVNILKMNIGEGFVLSTATLIAVIYCTGLLFENLLLGKGIYCGLAVLGIVLTLIQIFRKKFEWFRVYSVHLGLLFFVLGLSIVLYYNDYIRYIDELHMWAVAPRYMLNRNRLPIYDDFIWGKAENIGTCIFHYFFQSFTEYNEGMLYASGALLSWIGLLLPISNQKDRAELVIYTLYVSILFFAMPTLYVHGFKNVYVDVPVATWVGGLAGWSFYREKKWQNGILIFAVMCVAYTFKDNIGLVLDGFFLLLIFTSKVLVYHVNGFAMNKRKIVMGSIIVALVSTVLVLCFIFFMENYDLYKIMPEPLKGKLSLTWYTFVKVKKTTRTLLIMALGKPLGASSEKMKISYMAAIFICILIVTLYGYICSRQYESVLYVSYMIICTVLFTVLVLAVYIFGMPNVYAVRAWAGHRYLAIYIIYLFVATLSLFLMYPWKNKDKERITMLSGLLLLLFFVYGVRNNSLIYYTSIVNKKNKNYYKIQEQKEQAAQIQKIVGTEKKVYFLNQKSDRFDEYGMNPAFFYMDKQINHIWSTPWQYTESGAIIRYNEYGDVRIDDFSTVLSSGDYSYVWIYKTNDYLNMNLPKVIPLEDNAGRIIDNTTIEVNDGSITIDKNCANIIDGQLYKIVYNKKGVVTKLKFSRNLRTFDNRVDHKYQVN